MKCKMCKKEMLGRSDKIFCSINCKSYYHRQLRKVTRLATERIDEILHRNRSILLELTGKHKTQIKLNRIMLDKKKFNYRYHTHQSTNSKGKRYYHLYDFAWMEFSNDEILIIRK